MGNAEINDRRRELQSREQAEYWRTGPSRANGAMENANGSEPSSNEGSWTISGEASDAGSYGESPRSGLRLFAPGPGAINQWSGIVTDFACLAPAVEPGIRVLADGVALVVDESRADQLRCGGNGVVATAAAIAFAVLLGRLG
jgi:DNA (cytosine-5)-methyltransferase 1